MKLPPESAGEPHLLWSTRDYKIHPFQQIRNLIIHAIERDYTKTETFEIQWN